jgi:hypothetical protein
MAHRKLKDSVVVGRNLGTAGAALAHALLGWLLLYKRRAFLG